MTMPISLTPSEKRTGLVYLAFNLLFLPLLISLAGAALALDTAQVNIIYYMVNFAAVLWIFRKFLRGNLLVALDRVFPVLWYAALAYLGQETIGELLNALIYSINPAYINQNDATVANLVLRNPFFGFCVVTVVPIAEETLYRGLVFRGLYDRSPMAAYLVSMAVFSAIHVTAYIGRVSPLHLALSFLQYLPAAYCLCFAYRRSGTILSPIFVHMAINAIGVFGLMR